MPDFAALGENVEIRGGTRIAVEKWLACIHLGGLRKRSSFIRTHLLALKASGRITGMAWIERRAAWSAEVALDRIPMSLLTGEDGHSRRMKTYMLSSAEAIEMVDGAKYFVMRRVDA